MLSIANVGPGNAYHYYFRGVMVGDGQRPASKPLKLAQEEAGIPPGMWLGRGLPALGLVPGAVVTERQAELLFSEGRHPDADRIEHELTATGETRAAARRATILGRAVTDITSPVLALDLVFRPQATIVVLWALGDDRTRRIIERAHEQAITATFAWLEDAVAEIRWGSGGRHRAKVPALAVARFRHFENRDGYPLLHDHCVTSVKVQRPDGTWGNLDTRRLYQHVVAAGTLYTLLITEEVCEELGLATEPRTATPGLRPVMEIAGVPHDLIDWAATRREQILDALEGITDTYVAKHKRLPGERAQHGLAWWAAQDTRREKKQPKPLGELRVWWRASAVLNFGVGLVDGLLQQARTAAASIRTQVRPWVDTVLAAIDVAAVVYVVRGSFARRHILAEARRHLAETLRGRPHPRGLDDYITDAALSRYGQQLTRPQPGRRPPPPDLLTYTATWGRPGRWWVAGTDGKPPQASTAYERAQVASRALQDAMRAARTGGLSCERSDGGATGRALHHREHDQKQPADAAADRVRPSRGGEPAVPAVTATQRAAIVHAHQQAAMPEQLQLPGTDAQLEPAPADTEPAADPAPAPESGREPEQPEKGRTTDPLTWPSTARRLAERAAWSQQQVRERARLFADPAAGQHPHPSTASQHAQQQQPGHSPGQQVPRPR
ncbi:MobF family relaxase [Streptomyces sp. NPDC005498]|uniref:MobF family relaxase n=1 Tax=Streptomyces sp. NPDC005498 TaxID=3364717 RepID=UPI003695C068